MPEHLHTGRCLLVAAAAIAWAAAAQAAPKDDAAKGAGAEDASPAIRLDQLGGTWKNLKSGVNVRIEQGAVGWEVWFSTSGEAKITLPEKNRPAIKIDGRNFTCSYSVTLPSAQTMKWDLTQGHPEAQCPTGAFTRIEPAPSEHKPAASAASEGKPAAKIEPAPMKRPPEAKRPAEAAAVIEPAPKAHARPLWTPPPRAMPRHAAAYRRPPARFVIRHRHWRIARALRPYAPGGYRPYRYLHYRYRWYVVLIPRCGCR
jgi:hypothetical protein